MRWRSIVNPVALALCSLGAVVTTAACGATPEPTAKPWVPADEARIQRALDRVIAAGAPGAVVLVRDPNGTGRLASGYGDLKTKTRMRATDRFRIASVTKTFVATVVLQLVGERRLTLADTVDRWLPGLVPNGDRITVRELLNHTSGIFDIASDQGFVAQILWKPQEIWTPRQVVRLATAHRPLFAPGTGWAYSNTGYTVLGLIVEAATRHSIGAELRRRIFEPLSLRHTSFDTSPRIAGTFAHGYYSLGGPRRDVTELSPTSAWAAGAVVSTADDVANFYRALLRGRLLRPRLLRAMETTVPVPEDPAAGGSGLGLVETGVPCGRVWGHEGTGFGYKTVAYSSKNATRQVVVMTNDSPPSPVAANALARLVATAYCTGRPAPRR